MNFDVAGLRSWCMKRPRPDGVRLSFSDGTDKYLPRTNEQSWQEIAETIAALEPTLIECVKTDGTVIRATKSDEMGKEDRARDNGRVPLPTALHSDPETARLCYTADLLHRAYQHATDVAFDKVTAAYDTGFARLIDLVEKIGERSDAIERRLERAETAYRREVNERLEEALAAAQEQGQGGVADFLQNFMGGIAMGNAAAPTNGKVKA